MRQAWSSIKEKKKKKKEKDVILKQNLQKKKKFKMRFKNICRSHVAQKRNPWQHHESYMLKIVFFFFFFERYA